jgi:ABC-type Mn2+/Zn2+ transport system ATPase subunit
MAIEKKLPKTPTDVVYVALSLLQKWIVMLKEADREHIKHVLEDVKQWMKTFKPSMVEISDVGEI